MKEYAPKDAKLGLEIIREVCPGKMVRHLKHYTFHA
jgi:hypothetical protein